MQYYLSSNHLFIMDMIEIFLYTVIGHLILSMKHRHYIYVYNIYYVLLYALHYIHTYIILNDANHIWPIGWCVSAQTHVAYYAIKKALTNKSHIRIKTEFIVQHVRNVKWCSILNDKVSSSSIYIYSHIHIIVSIRI